MIHTPKENFVSVKCSPNTSSCGYLPTLLNGDNNVSLPGLREALQCLAHDKYSRNDNFYIDVRRCIRFITA